MSSSGRSDTAFSASPSITLSQLKSNFKKKKKPPETSKLLPKSAYLKDGYRVIDFVIAYKPNSSGKKKAERQRFRQKFENILKKMGLILEYEGKESSPDKKTAYIKIHSTWEVLSRQAELERVQMPTMISDIPGKPTPLLDRICGKLFNNNPFALQQEYTLEHKDYFTDAFERAHENHFIIDDRETFFTPAQRIYLTWSAISQVTIPILTKRSKKKNKKKNTMSDQEDLSNGNSQGQVKTANINWMMLNGMYETAYPIHDGEIDGSDEMDYTDVPPNRWPMRKYLYESWARPKQWYKHQPLQEIRDYYGEKVGMYFAWLGFYTQMLILPSIVGVMVFIYGIFDSAFSPYVDEYCNVSGLFCRECPQTYCEFQSADTVCGTARFTRVFDNPSAGFFAVFMAIWGVVFLELWKRYRSELCARWDVSEGEFNQEQMRPDYLIKVSTTKLNHVTGKQEPALRKRSVYQRIGASMGVVAFFVAIVLTLLVTVMIYKKVGPRLWTDTVRYKDEYGRTRYSFSPVMITSITASVLNGLFIAVMTKVYSKVAWQLTVMEMPRTDAQFEESYTYKVAIFQFVNFYGALFYLAFLRGPLAQNDPSDINNMAAGDVSIQLFIIMTGKQAINNILEIGLPKLKNFIRRCRSKVDPSDYANYERWERDANLEPPAPLNLFGDYLEMWIQFGFITMFVPAFPLAPLFALINNIIEIRLDAHKMLAETRRVIPVRANNIGPWYDLLAGVTKIAVFTNAAVIALTTTFVDHQVYQIYKAVQDDPDKYSFIDFNTFSFNTIGWDSEKIATSTAASNDTLGAVVPDSYNDLVRFEKEVEMNGTKRWVEYRVNTCKYRDYRIGVEHPNANERNLYDHSAVWCVNHPTINRDFIRYHVMLGRALFVIIFEHVVFLLQSLLGYLIPDTPDYVITRQHRETFLQRQSFKEEEQAAKGVVEEDQDIADIVSQQNGLDVRSLAAQLPKEVAVNQYHLEEQAEEEARNGRKQPFIMNIMRRGMFC